MPHTVTLEMPARGSDQHQSPLFQLPGELRNEIWDMALTSSAPIVNPYVRPDFGGLCIEPAGRSIPPLGIGLLASCRQAHQELTASMLLTTNRFRFTNPAHANRFLRGLGADRAALVRDVELNVACGLYDDLARSSWSMYPTWAPTDGVWAKKVGNLRADAPGLQTLRLDVGNQIVWTFLQNLLAGPRGLQRVVVSGTTELHCSVAWRISAWDFELPMNFVGRPKGDPTVVDLMTLCVAGEDGNKFVRWSMSKGSVTIEVLTAAALRETEWTSLVLSDFPGETLPVEGLCTFANYQAHKDWRIERYPQSRKPNLFN